MAASPSYSSTVKVSGTAVVITGEACTGLGGGQWQVTSAARRILDPYTAIVVKDGVATVAATLYTVDILFGIITFVGYSPSGAITINAAYLPTTAVAEVKSFSLDMKADLADSTSFDSSGAKQKVATLSDFTASFDGYALPTLDLDAVAAGTQSLLSWLQGGTPKLLEVKLSSTHYWRGWGLLETEGLKTDVGGLNTFSTSMSGAAPAGYASWSIGT